MVDIVEESILVDIGRTHGRRRAEGGATVDLTGFAEFGLVLTFRSRPDGTIEFVDFVFTGD